MVNSTSHAGFVRNGARIAHTFVRDQVLAILAPRYYLYHRRAMADQDGEIADATTCGPHSAIELQPNSIGRS